MSIFHFKVHPKKDWKHVGHKLQNQRHQVQRCVAIMPFTCVGIVAPLLAWEIFSSHPNINCPATYYANSKTVPDGKNCGSYSHHSVCSSIRIIKTNLHWLVCRCWGEFTKTLNFNRKPKFMKHFFDPIDIPLDHPASKTQFKRSSFLSYHSRIMYTFSGPTVSIRTIVGWKCWRVQHKRKISKIHAFHINKRPIPGEEETTGSQTNTNPYT